MGVMKRRWVRYTGPFSGTVDRWRVLLQPWDRNTIAVHFLWCRMLFAISWCSIYRLYLVACWRDDTVDTNETTAYTAYTQRHKPTLTTTASACNSINMVYNAGFTLGRHLAAFRVHAFLQYECMQPSFMHLYAGCIWAWHLFGVFANSACHPTSMLMTHKYMVHVRRLMLTCF